MAVVGCTDDDLSEAEQELLPGPAATIMTNKPLYGVNEGITVSWTGMPGNAMDFVSLNFAGSAPNAGFIRWAFINGQVSGSQMFLGLQPGNYEARAYVNNTYQIAASVQFTVSGARVTTSAPSYQANQPITINWTGLPGNAMDYISINDAGSQPDQGFRQTQFTNGLKSGSLGFNGLPAGNYEARAYLNNTFTILARYSFTVAAATTTVTTDAATYKTGKTITVSYAGLPGNAQDWIAIAPVSSPATTALAYKYTGGATSGTAQFSGFGPGTYEARAYVNNTYTILARSAPFTVTVNNTCVSSSTRPVFESLTTGELTLDATQLQNTVPLTVALDRTILFTTVREAEPSPKHGGVMCQLHDVDNTQMLPAGITCDRATAGTDSANSTGSVTIRYTAVTFTSGVTVQRGVANTGFGTPVTVPLNAVDPAKSFVLLGGSLVGGSGWGNNEFARAQLVDGTTLDVRTNTAGSQVSWQVVEMTGATVRRGTTTLGMAATSTQVTTTTVPTGSMVLASYTTDNVSGIEAAAMMLRTAFSGVSAIQFTRAQGGSNLDISWEIVSLPFATTLGTTTLTAGQASASAAVANIVAATSVGFGNSQGILGPSTGSTTYAGADLDLVGEAAATLTTGTNSLSIERAASSASADIAWTVIDFAHDCNGL